MNLHKNLTDIDLAQPVIKAKEALAKAAAEGADSEHLLDLVHQVWAEEAVARARYEIVACLGYYEDSDGTVGEGRALALKSLYADILVRGADDTWSGRKNDARRVAFDAVRRLINDLRWTLR